LKKKEWARLFFDPVKERGLSLPVTEGAGFAETEDAGFSPSVKKVMAFHLR